MTTTITVDESTLDRFNSIKRQIEARNDKSYTQDEFVNVLLVEAEKMLTKSEAA